MTSSRALRWITALATIVLLVAIAIGAAIAAAWSTLPSTTPPWSSTARP